MTYEFLQQYWWVLISLLGALLVFLLFVQGANTFIFSLGKSESEKSLIINCTGRKWEFTFTTLVVFGGAFFASFPLFYSTSFGGAYWVWMAILLLFVLQAVAYEFQHRSDKPVVVKAFRIALVANGYLAPFLLGAAVASFFTGSDFSVNKDAMGAMSPVISTWGNNWHGLEALADWRCWAFGLMVMTLAQTGGLLYMKNRIDDERLEARMGKALKLVAPAFVLLFLVSAGFILLGSGYAVASDGTVSLEPFKYWHNLIASPVTLVMLLVGVGLVLASIALGIFKGTRKAVWVFAPGVVLTVMALLFLIGFNGTAYYPSSSDLQSSLTLANSCSSEFTLRTMFYVSLALPFVIAYMAYAWASIEKKAITSSELSSSEDKY